MTVDYYSAPWCPACVTFLPVAEKVAEEKGITLVYRNIDDVDDQKEAIRFNIREIPTLVASGQTLVGARSETELGSWLDDRLR